MTIIAIYLAAIVLAWLVADALTGIERRYERRTGRDWHAGQPK